ncbi:MAG: ATP phosphoribosyltransferase regulatory subunit [Ardenticatenales bacterium]|nr:ATP phosphoribosyltransferase regulatory subunit [Ardenticatenales bacterium]
MTSSPRRLRQLPSGVHDLFGAPAQQLIDLSTRLRALLARWAYHEVLPPTFEYFDTVMLAFDADFAAEVYRFVDPDGHLLALRPDLTVPVARLVATKLYDQPMPQRLSYVAPVFRFSEPNSHRSCQVWQAGWELIGVASPAADAEVVTLLVAALEEAGLQEFQVNLGHMGFVRATLADTTLNEDARTELLRAVDRKNRKILAQTLDESGVAGPARAVLEALPDLWGGEEVLEKALRLAPNLPAREAIEHLQQVYQLLQSYGIAERVTLDLGEVRGMDYYTGVIFELFAGGSGFSIASGGRYDTLLGRFGAGLPAIGAMIELERVQAVLHHLHGLPTLAPPDALQQQCDHAACLQALLERRRAGEHIELDLHQRPLPALRAEAEQRHIPRVIPCQQERAS